MKKTFMFSIFALICIFFCGCGERVIVNGIAYNVLNAEEEKEMLSFARMTLLNSNQKFTQKQKNFILNTMPDIRISYTGDKAGRISYEWICDDDFMVRLNCNGEFLSSNMQVSARKIDLSEDIKKGQKSGLEKLTFKEIKF